MDMGCSLKGSIASTIAYWDNFNTYIIYDFSQLSKSGDMSVVVTV
jgi:hypothetical protein